MRVLGFVFLSVLMGASFMASAQGVGGGGGFRNGVDVAMLTGGVYPRFPYYASDVSCNYLQAAIQENEALVIYESKHIYKVYALHSLRCGDNQQVQQVWLRARDGMCAMPRCVRKERD